MSVLQEEGLDSSKSNSIASHQSNSCVSTSSRSSSISSLQGASNDDFVTFSRDRSVSCYLPLSSRSHLYFFIYLYYIYTRGFFCTFLGGCWFNPSYSLYIGHPFHFSNVSYVDIWRWILNIVFPMSISLTWRSFFSRLHLKY